MSYRYVQWVSRSPYVHPNQFCAPIDSTMHMGRAGETRTNYGKVGGAGNTAATYNCNTGPSRLLIQNVRRERLRAGVGKIDTVVS